MAELFRAYTPNTVIGFGAIASLNEIIKKYAPTKILVLTDKGLKQAGVLDKLVTHLKASGSQFDIHDTCETEPTISGIEALGQMVKSGRYDLLIGIGGGSVMDATKIVSMIAANDDINTYDLIDGQKPDKTISKILIPTTAGTGSEWSPGAVVADDKVSNMTKVVFTQKVYPDEVIIDPELTLNLPPKITAITGIDALTHCIEGYFGTKSNVYSDMINSTAIQLIAGSLRSAYLNGSQDKEARLNMSIAAALAIQGGAISGAPLVHILNEALGKKAHIPHGVACGLLLPHVMKFNYPSNPEKFAKIARLMGKDTQGLSTLEAAVASVESVQKLITDVNLPVKLADATDFPLTEGDITAMTEQASKAIPLLNATNPRPVTPNDITQIYRSIL